MSVSNTMRITKFGGLNKSVNPHNIKDNEMVEMENLFVTKSGTLESRMGHKKIGDVASSYCDGLWTTAWADGDERLYYHVGYSFGKMVGSTATGIDSYPRGTQGITALRYKDKMLFLGHGDYLRWYGTAESLAPVRYPEFVRAVPLSGAVTSEADSETVGANLEVDQEYQYSITVELGTEGKDGETANAAPSTSYWLSEYYNPAPHILIQGDYAHGHADTGELIVKGTAVKYSCNDMHGFTAYAVKLWMRKASAAPIGIDGTAPTSATGSWVLLDRVTLSKLGEIYIPDQSQYGVITGLTATHSATTDICEIFLTWQHCFKDQFVDEVPYESVEVVSPKAKYMTRLHGQIFLANIVTDSVQDCKKIYFSYKGLMNVDGAMVQQIQGYTYPDPMLIFPQMSFFFCDPEDVEDPITGIHAYENNVMIFTKRCTFVWREGMGEPIKLSNEIGCIANDTIGEFEGKLVWLARNGVYMYNGSQIENITWSKVHPYIDDMRNESAGRATSAVYGRKYFLCGPFESTNNDLVLVYDFDLRQWHVRRYNDHSGTAMNIHKMHVDYDGNDETLYFAGAGTDGECYIGTLEDGYCDGDEPITCTFKTKYYDFGAPDIYKIPRVWYLNIENYAGTVTTSVYVDSLNEAKSTVVHQNNVDGFIINSATAGVINSDYIKNLSDELTTTSLNRGLQGSRIQFAATMTALAAPLRIHMIGFEWVPTRKLKRKYGA